MLYSPQLPPYKNCVTKMKLVIDIKNNEHHNQYSLLDILFSSMPKNEIIVVIKVIIVIRTINIEATTLLPPNIKFFVS